MALLTDTDLREIICTNKEWRNKNKIHIHPFSEGSLTFIGYDLRVGNSYSSAFRGGPISLNETDKIIN